MNNYPHICLCSSQISFCCAQDKSDLKNILYHICFDNTDSLPGDDDDGDDTGDISTCDVEARHDEVAEICRKQVIWYNAIMSHLFSEIWLYIYSFLDVAVENFSTIVFVYPCPANLFHM